MPGRSFSGKTTLVRELVRAGATYYSDDYAVFDAHGHVHPFPRQLSIRPNRAHRQERHSVESLGGIAGDVPLPVGLVAVTRYDPRVLGWRPRSLSAGQGVLELLAHAVAARRSPEAVLEALHRGSADAQVLKGRRGEAERVANADPGAGVVTPRWYGATLLPVVLVATTLVLAAPATTAPKRRPAGRAGPAMGDRRRSRGEDRGQEGRLVSGRAYAARARRSRLSPHRAVCGFTRRARRSRSSSSAVRSSSTGRAATPRRRTRARTGSSRGPVRAPDPRRRSKAAALGLRAKLSVRRSIRSTGRSTRRSERRSAELLRRPDLREAYDALLVRAGPRGPKRRARRRRPGADAGDHRVAVMLNGRALGAIALVPLLTSQDGSRFLGGCSMSERTS